MAVETSSLPTYKMRVVSGSSLRRTSRVVFRRVSPYFMILLSPESQRFATGPEGGGRWLSKGGREDDEVGDTCGPEGGAAWPEGGVGEPEGGAAWPEGGVGELEVCTDSGWSEDDAETGDAIPEDMARDYSARLECEKLVAREQMNEQKL